MRRYRLIRRRKALAYSQESLAHRIGVHRTTVGQWERGEREPEPWNRPSLAEALCITLDKLEDLLTSETEAYADAPSVDRRATEPNVDRREFVAGALAAAALPALPHPPVTSEIVDLLGGQLDEYWRADRTFGPHLLIDGAEAQCRTVLRAARSTHGTLHQGLLRLGVAYTGLVSWLYQDAGDVSRCSIWLADTLDLAHRVGDPELIAYALTCKALVQADADDGVGAVDLAHAALAASTTLGVKARVMAMQHAAFGHALNQERADVDRQLDQIGELLTGITDDQPWGGDRLRRDPAEIVDLHRATCYDRMGLADAAAPLWERVMLRPADEKRDRGVYLARHASTLVDLGEHDQAAERAHEGLSYLRSTGSARMHREFQRLRRKATTGPVHEVLAAIA